MENITYVTNVSEVLRFAWIDYFFFAALFGISLAIGIYFGCFGEKKETTDEYLFGGRTMSIFPIAMSLAASHVSGTTLLGLPAEVYQYGSQYMSCTISAAVCSYIIVYVYLPVFYKLQTLSSYEYLMLRFNSKVRTIASFLYALATILHTPLVIYIPALAFNQVSGIDVHQITPIICAICIFYTTIGGIKAVVWADTIQYMVSFASTFAVLYLGISATGGIGAVWQKADEGGRVEFFNMDMDVTSRSTFWGVTIGLLFNWISSLGVNPSSVQRFLAVPSIHAARRSVFIFLFGVILTKALSCFSGFVLYAKYSGCDPQTAGYITRSDQLLPYYVLDVAKNIPGLAGLFVSGVFSAALSTMSTSINALAGTVFEDFVVPWAGPIPEKRSNHILKTLVVIIGIVCVLLVFVVEHLGGVVQMSISFSGVTHGPLLGLFTLGMFFRSANSKGALVGGVTTLLIMSWIVMGAQYNIMQKRISHAKKPFSVTDCDPALNLTTLFNSTTTIRPHAAEEPFFLYRISFYWYTLIGVVLTILIGLPVSWLFGDKNEKPPHPDLLTPVVKWFHSKEESTADEYKSVSLHELSTHNFETDKEKCGSDS